MLVSVMLVCCINWVINVVREYRMGLMNFIGCVKYR